MKEDPLLNFEAAQRSEGTPANGEKALGLGRFWAEVLSLTFMSILVPVVVFLDATILFDHMSEGTLTEWTQAGLIAGTAVLFFIGACTIPAATGYLMSAATLCTCMFLRENDVYFDIIWHGFWIVPVSIVLCLGTAFAIRNRHTLREPFLRHAATREAAFLMIGFIFVLIFSRVYGSGDLWRAIMGPNYTWQIKAALQEGVELMGYSILAFGAFLSFRSGFGQRIETKDQ
ncbi:MAG: hypothetical protein HKN30_02280 [Sulfitobacter sp.]|nr:hypothetical protein [Sulfitobacter sp.]